VITIKELYDWAKKEGIENYRLSVLSTACGCPLDVVEAVRMDTTKSVLVVNEDDR
jgi:hypothetical protein